MRKIFDLLPVVLLAAFGGFAGTLANRKQGEPYTMKKAIQEIIIAVFSGLLIHYILLEYQVGENLRTAAIALAGYSARGVLALLHGLFLDHLKKFKLWLLPAVFCAVLLSAGCQSFSHRTYYEPNDVTMTRIDGRAYGAVQEETTHDGMPDWSEGKSLGVSVIGK